MNGNYKYETYQVDYNGRPCPYGDGWRSDSILLSDDHIESIVVVAEDGGAECVVVNRSDGVTMVIYKPDVVYTRKVNRNRYLPAGKPGC